MSTSLRNNGAVLAAAAALVLLGSGVGLALLWLPDVEGDPAFAIFYIHVPVALTAYGFFAWAAWKALRLLWTRDERYDLESYTAVHLGVIFGLLTLVTGSIWAKYTWGQWWVWNSRQLTLFLVLFLFYSAYFMLRYSIDAGPRRARMSAVYAIFGIVLLPVSFLAIRLAEDIIHPSPVVIRAGEPEMTWDLFALFCVCMAGMLALASALYQLELAGKRLDLRLRELREVMS